MPNVNKLKHMQALSIIQSFATWQWQLHFDCYRFAFELVSVLVFRRGFVFFFYMCMRIKCKLHVNSLARMNKQQCTFALFIFFFVYRVSCKPWLCLNPHFPFFPDFKMCSTTCLIREYKKNYKYNLWRRCFSFRAFGFLEIDIT